VPRAPTEDWAFLAGVISALEKELQIFEERAHSVGVELRGAPPAFACHAYVQFLLSTVHTRGYAESFTVLYAAERAYHESWKVVRDGIDPSSPWIPFVENWGGEDFGRYVEILEDRLEALATGAGPGERERMAELYRLTLLYEVAFWEMAHKAQEWPGVQGEAARAGLASPPGPVWSTDVSTRPDRAWSHVLPADEAHHTTEDE
jgi:thiaminase